MKPLFHAALIFFVPNFAAAQNYTLMAPMGSILSGSPDLTTYLQGAVTVIIGVAGILAVIMTVYCGIRLMMSQSASGKSEAKECIWNAVLGLLLAIGAWVLLYTVNPLLLSNELNLTDVALAPQSGGSPVIPQGIYQWSAGTSCAPVAGKIVSVMPPSYCSGTPPSPTSVCCGYANSPFPPRIGGSGVPTGTVPPSTQPPPSSTPLTPVAFSAPTFTVNEDGESVRVTVSRSSGLGVGSIDYYTSSSGETESGDYQEAFGTLTFFEGALTQSFDIAIINDTFIERPESFNVTLTNPKGVLSLGATGNAVINIVDNDDPAASSNNTPPVVVITAPRNNSVAAATVNVTFTASDDNAVKHIEYTYRSPASSRGDKYIICDNDCTSSPITMTIPVTMNMNAIGNHTITIRACDSRECDSAQVTVLVEEACIPSAFLNCKALPGMDVPGTGICSTIADTGGISVGTKIDAIAFRITSDNGGGSIFISTDESASATGYSTAISCSGGSGGGCSEADRDAGTLADDCRCRTDSDSGDVSCYYVDCYETDEGEVCRKRLACDPDSEDCTPPENLIASISTIPGDLTSTTATAYSELKGVSGYCGNINISSYSNPLGDSELRFNISVSASGATTCTLEKDRTYYLNITTLPFLDPSTTYYIFWNITK